MNLLKVLRLLSLYCLMGILLLCSIKNDNGNPVSTGPSTSTGTNNQIVNPVIIITPDSQYVGIRDTLSIAVTVMQDSLLTVVYSGAKVYCMANTGWFSAESLVTDSKGRAILKIMDTIQTKVLINLACGNTKQSFSITVTNTPNQLQNLLTITPARAVIKADGKDTTTVQVSLKNLNNNPVSGQCVQFITSAGMIAGAQTGCSGLGQVATNAQGMASAVLTSANVNDTVFVTAFLVSDMTKTVQTRVVFSGVTILLTADSTNLKPGSTETINAFFVNASNNPIAYAPVYFSIGKDTASSISFVSKDSVTGPDGYSHCVIKGTRPGSDSVRVVGSGAAASIKMNITNLSLAVSLDAKVLQAQASLSTLLHVVFTSSAGSPIANNPVILKRSYQTANGNDTSDILTATTNAQGKCAFTINALPYECVMSLTVSASTGTDMASSVTSISFLATRNVTINAIPTVIQADGTSNSTITVQVKTLNNNPIIGDQINFTATAGLVTASAKTDTNGRAIAVLTSDRRNTIATVKATLAIDTTVVKAVQVGFTGVSLAASANPQSISSSGKDSSVVTATLIDAAKNPIVGEPIYFSKLQDSTVISSADTVTNNRGIAQCKVSGTGSGIDTIKIIAAGDSQKVAINYSSNYLSIDTVAGQSCIANGIDSTRVLIKYFAGNKATFIPSASLAVSVTLGSIANSVAFAKQLTLVPADSGKLYFYMKNPGFANTATISVVATTASEMTTASYSLYFGSTKVRKIVLSGSPSVVATNGSKVSLTGVAFDSLGNRVSGELIAFNLISGPGGGEYLDPPTAISASDGTVSASLVSGTIPSIFHGVGVVASDISGIKSDTVLITIAGPPYNVSVGINLQQGQNFNDGTYGLPCAAIVTDVNGNPVADGTQVTFSLQVSGYVFWELNAGWNESATGGAFACNVYIDTVQKILPFNDYENCNENCVSNPGPAYEDINHDGRRQYDWRVPVEPLHTCSDGSMQFADLDGNGVWDPIEPLNDPVYLNAYHTLQIDSVYYKLLKSKPFPASDSVLLRTLAVMDSQYSAGTHFIQQLGIYAYDFSWAAQPYPQPPSAASITRTIQTVSGKAVNQIIYGQSIATRVQVTISAESQGIITQFPAQEVLPVVGGAASK